MKHLYHTVSSLDKTCDIIPHFSCFANVSADITFPVDGHQVPALVDIGANERVLSGTLPAASQKLPRKVPSCAQPEIIVPHSQNGVRGHFKSEILLLLALSTNCLIVQSSSS